MTEVDGVCGIGRTCATILERMDARELAVKVRSLFGQLVAAKGEPLRDAKACYADMAYHFAQSVSEEGHPSDRVYQRLRALKSDARVRIENGIKVDPPRSGSDRRMLEALHHMGGLAYPGDGATFSFFLTPHMLPVALRLLSRLDPPARRRHAAEVASLRGAALTPDQLSAIENDLLKPAADRLQDTLREAVAVRLERRVTLASLDLVLVEYLPTAVDFYEAGIGYYRQANWRRQHYYVFATTSGVLLPEERYGAAVWRDVVPIPALYEKSGKNPIRERYFKTLAACAWLQRYYYFELERARRAFHKTLTDIGAYASEAGLDAKDAVGRYEDAARKSVTSFLRRRKFGLYEVSRFPKEFDYLTLGNGRALIMSARDDGTDRIGHGFMLHATEGLWSSIRDSIDFRRLTRDLLPPGPPSTPARYLIPPLLRGLLPVVAGIWKGLRTMQRRRRLLDIASRICQTIAREQIDWGA